MLTFFRRIRKELLGSRQVGKYILYATGEILLVVLGILIALQINNWNERNKEQATSMTYVNNLIDDLSKDSDMYDDQIRAAQLKFQFCKEIFGIVKDRESIIDTSKFIVNLQAAGRLILPTITDNTYNDLVSTGNIKLIKDKKSIDALREYYNNPLDFWYEDYKNQLVNGYLPIVVNAIPLHLHEEILENEIIDKFQDFTDKALLNNQVVGYTSQDVLKIFSALRDNDNFYFNLKRITRSHLLQYNILGKNKKSAVALLETLEDWKLVKAQGN